MSAQHRRQNSRRAPKHPTGVWVRCVRDIVDGPRANEIVRIFAAEKAVTIPEYSWTESAHDTVYWVEAKSTAYNVTSMSSPLQDGMAAIPHGLLSKTPNGQPAPAPYKKHDKVYLRGPGIGWAVPGGPEQLFSAGTPVTIETATESPKNRWHYVIRIDRVVHYATRFRYPIALAHLDVDYRPEILPPLDPLVPPSHFFHG